MGEPTDAGDHLIDQEVSAGPDATAVYRCLRCGATAEAASEIEAVPCRGAAP